jgi:hypothetical protein
MSHSKLKLSRCSNCGTHLSVLRNYCPQCGQINHDLNIPLKHLIAEVMESIFHFDTKSVQTLKVICFKPGFITSEFIKGKRVQYVAPVKFYIFISFIFFLIISLPKTKQGTSLNVENTSNITYCGINSTELRSDMQQSQLDSVMQSHAIVSSIMNRYIIRQLSRIGADGQEGFNHMLVKSASYMMFVLMPLFALFVFMLNRKKAKYYIGTLIFSLHYHSFVFLLLTLSLITDRIIGTSIILIIPIIVSPIYLLMALKHVYGDSLLRTTAKTIFIGISQFVSMGLLFILTTLITLLIF